MNKIILTGIVATLIGASAYASDGGMVTETYTSSEYVRANSDTIYYAEQVKPAPARAYTTKHKCARPATMAAPVAVKTHTEVINHYTVYQPVTKYVPVGTVSTREVVETPRSCNRCGY